MRQPTIYHNPRCSKSRATLELLTARGFEPRVVDYLKTPPSVAEIEALLDMLGIEPRALMRSDEDEYSALALADSKRTRKQLIAAIAAHPRLMQRPVVVVDGKAAIGFAAHLANWELPGIGAKLIGVKSAVLYRRPNIGAVNDAIVKLRAPLMGELIPTGLDAPVRLARLLESGVHVGMLADQHYSKGVEVIFFGRRCLANPLIAMLARQTELPIYGMRVVRKTDGNSFWGEISAPVQPVRDADGRIQVSGTMQAITSVIEGWIRQFPEQWLWLHRRWR